MFGLGLYLARYAVVWRLCHATAMATWASIHPATLRQPDALAIADAIATSVAEDPAPLWDPRTQAAVMAEFAYRESSLRAHAIGDGGRSHGAWQQQRAVGRAELVDQARGWLVLVHEGADACGSADGALRMVSSGACDRAGKLVAARMREVRAVVGD